MPTTPSLVLKHGQWEPWGQAAMARCRSLCQPGTAARVSPGPAPALGTSQVIMGLASAPHRGHGCVAGRAALPRASPCRVIYGWGKRAVQTDRAIKPGQEVARLQRLRGTAATTIAGPVSTRLRHPWHSTAPTAHTARHPWHLQLSTHGTASTAWHLHWPTPGDLDDTPPVSTPHLHPMCAARVQPVSIPRPSRVRPLCTAAGCPGLAAGRPVAAEPLRGGGPTV